MCIRYTYQGDTTSASHLVCYIIFDDILDISPFGYRTNIPP